MPELPEVEAARRLVERAALGRVITCVQIVADPIVFEGVSAARFRRALTGRPVQHVKRRGKHMWLALEDGPSLLLHLGMSGGIRAPNITPPRYKSDGRQPLDLNWPPRWLKLRLVFDDGHEIAMIDKRRFGRIRLRDDVENQPPISELGFDPLLDLPSPARFSALLRKRKAPIKAVLLDQSFAAGVGNWIADEVLYQAKIDPRRLAISLTEKDAKQLRTALRRVIVKAVQVNAEKSKFPKDWLFHERWGRNAQAKTARGERIEHLTVAGRTTAWVPAVQK